MLIFVSPIGRCCASAVCFGFSAWLKLSCKKKKMGKLSLRIFNIHLFLLHVYFSVLSFRNGAQALVANRVQNVRVDLGSALQLFFHLTSDFFHRSCVRYFNLVIPQCRLQFLYGGVQIRVFLLFLSEPVQGVLIRVVYSIFD